MLSTIDKIITGKAPEGSQRGFFLDADLQLTFCDGERAWQTRLSVAEALAMYLELHRQLALIPAAPVGNA